MQTNENARNAKPIIDFRVERIPQQDFIIEHYAVTATVRGSTIEMTAKSESIFEATDKATKAAMAILLANAGTPSEDLWGTYHEGRRTIINDAACAQNELNGCWKDALYQERENARQAAQNAIEADIAKYVTEGTDSRHHHLVGTRDGKVIVAGVSRYSEAYRRSVNEYTSVSYPRKADGQFNWTKIKEAYLARAAFLTHEAEEHAAKKDRDAKELIARIAARAIITAAAFTCDANVTPAKDGRININFQIPADAAMLANVAAALEKLGIELK